MTRPDRPPTPVNRPLARKISDDFRLREIRIFERQLPRLTALQELGLRPVWVAPFVFFGALQEYGGVPIRRTLGSPYGILVEASPSHLDSSSRT